MPRHRKGYVNRIVPSTFPPVSTVLAIHNGKFRYDRYVLGCIYGIATEIHKTTDMFGIERISLGGDFVAINAENLQQTKATRLCLWDELISVIKGVMEEHKASVQFGFEIGVKRASNNQQTLWQIKSICQTEVFCPLHGLKAAIDQYCVKHWGENLINTSKETTNE